VGGLFGGHSLSRAGDMLRARPTSDISDPESHSMFMFWKRGVSLTDNTLCVCCGIAKLVSATAEVGRGLPVYMLQSVTTVVVVRLSNRPALVGSSWGSTRETTVAGLNVGLANTGDSGEASWLRLVAVLLITL